MKELCDIKTIAEYLNVSVPYIRKLVRAEAIPCFRIGNRIKFDIKEINEWVDSHKCEEHKNEILI